ncbi:glycosyltransferase family 2 protein [Geodermatophilus normandii]|uniref:glycosyltransferase family 2 protein n=1 Tax=Geodermatophilus normandii TaxID=1137989 RepID=UPI00147367E9|nr:glycosyltransferase family 2 protein [Geodermatophilus normandii]
MSVVIPCCNEARNLPALLLALPTVVDEVVLVDGHSVDGSPEVARAVRPDVLVVRQNRRGKGNAVACGLAVASGDVIVTMDADGSADPQEIPRLLSALQTGADCVTATRFPSSQALGDAAPAPVHRWGSRAAAALSGAPCTDVGYGFAAFWAGAVPSLRLGPGSAGARRQWGDGPEVDAVLQVRMVRNRRRVVEVPVPEGRAVRQLTWRDAARVVGAVLVERCAGARGGVRAEHEETALRPAT